MERKSVSHLPPHLCPLPLMGGEGRVRGRSKLHVGPLLLRNSVNSTEILIQNNHKSLVHGMPLRIGILMDHPSPHMVALLDALAEREDCLAEVIYLGRVAPERHWGAPAGQLPCRFLKGLTLGTGGLRMNIDLLHTLRKAPVDIWLVNSVFSSPSTLLAAWWLGRNSIPWVYMNEPPRPRHRWIWTIKSSVFKFLLQRSWGVIGMGEKVVQMYQHLLKDPRPMVSIPYYINLEEFFQLPIPHISGNGKTLKFLSCGQMIHRKGLDILLRACEQLEDMNWQLTLVGDGPLRRRLEQEFARRFPPAQVLFRGEVPYAIRHKAFVGHHIFLFPSRWDGWGMVMAEALAAGLPVIATDQVMAAHELIHSGMNGFLIPANDPKALADRMAYFLRHPETIPRMALAARQMIQGYRPEVGAERLVNFLADLVRNAEIHHKKRNPKILGEPLTWEVLTSRHSLAGRAWKYVRQWVKRKVILAGNAVRSNGRPRGHRILVYHLVLKEDRKSFEEHIKFLKDSFEICSVSEILRAVSREDGDGIYRLAITFDDGFRILMQDCLEVLESYSVKGNFLVPTGFVELADQPEWAARFSLRAHYYNFPLEPMRAEDLQMLRKLGHEVGSHGISHSSIAIMSRQQASRELKGSGHRIAQWTGLHPEGFAYPYGHTVSALGDPTAWVRQAGYKYALTLHRGAVRSASNPFLLPREHVEGNWSLRDLRYFLLK